ncbi:MAG: glycine zipper 2TM domain-containing protein [Betaproteobacteria bacterium]|nr:glycine zipper 2TM domain-containing protein [Betaproteobacteria bacterium]
MENRNSMLYPMMILAAISVIVFSVLGIAAITGHMPTAFSQKSGAAATEPASAVQPARRAASSTPRGMVAAGVCGNCGVVESVRIVTLKGDGSGVGAVTGGLAGAILGNQVGGGNGRTATTLLGAAGGAYVGNEVEKNMKKSSAFRITVRMDDGTYRSVTQGSEAGIAVGQRVKVVDGRVMAVS